MRIRTSVLLALFALFATQTRAQIVIPSGVRAAADRITVSQVSSDIEYLASDLLGGRDTFGPGLDSAAQFIVRRLRRANLRPNGDNKTYLQHFALKGGIPDTAAIFLEFGGRRFGFGDLLLNPFVHAIDTTTSVVFVGSGVRMKSRSIDSYAGLDLKGKLVLALHEFPNGVSFENLPNDFEGPRSAPVKVGALGTLLIPMKPVLDNWNGIRSGPLWIFSELDPPVPTGQTPITTILVRPELARLLLVPHQGIADRILDRPTGAEFPPAFELAQQVRIHIPAVEYRRTTYNIVASIKGSDPRLNSEYVTIAAHLDGAVGAPLVAGDSAYNAADDNASGSAAILAVAEQMMRAPRPRRSVMFIWDTGHEIGLYGSQEFMASGIVPADKIVTHFNVDMIGGTASLSDTASHQAKAHEVFVIGPRVLSTGLDSLVERTNRAYLNLKLNHQYDDPDSEFYYPRTDSRPLIEHGIPTIEFFTGLHARYHRSNDEARYLDMRKVQEVSRTLMATVWAIANAPQRPVVDKGFPARVVRVH
ncbi:MAG: M28 family peptidase [Gemmatimonadota bacterium]|nr:M28 family peptidase [Gemmatimonadota bacterium]